MIDTDENLPVSAHELQFHRRSMEGRKCTSWSYPTLPPGPSAGPLPSRKSTSLCVQRDESVRSRKESGRRRLKNGKSPFLQALSITTEVIRTSPPVNSRAASTGNGVLSPPLSPSLARKSRVHFWSNFFNSTAQQDRSVGGQPRSKNRRSSCCGGSPSSPELLQHSNTSKSFTHASSRIISSSKSSPATRQPHHSSTNESSPDDSPGADWPSYEEEIAEILLAASSSHNARMARYHGGPCSAPSSAAQSCLSLRNTSIAVPCISEPTSSAQLPLILPAAPAAGGKAWRASSNVHRMDRLRRYSDHDVHLSGGGELP
uniref:Uncharacterized protein n=1 Tax=Dunaliella tertiolecta TaxID=3047 RepID=A0A7S3R9Z5_DUNTE